MTSGQLSRPHRLGWRWRQVSRNGRGSNPAVELASSHPQPAIEVRGLVKAFGQTRAVDGIDLMVPASIVFGVLGRNGASETTTDLERSRSGHRSRWLIPKHWRTINSRVGAGGRRSYARGSSGRPGR